MPSVSIFGEANCELCIMNYELNLSTLTPNLSTPPLPFGQNGAICGYDLEYFNE